ncbi:PH domain-containing protein [Candidatus Acetothermia bacterium]|nr:PH domain-containing protein [Candidatus Acetothermia bacterium]
MANQTQTTRGVNAGLPFELAPNEKVLVDTRPFPLAYTQFYFPSFYLFVLADVLLLLRDDFLTNNLTTFYIVLAVLILGPAAIYSFLKLNLRYVINSVLGLAIAIGVKHFLLRVPWQYLPENGWLINHVELLILAVFGLAGLISAEIYRRSHRYIVTNARIFTHAGIFAPDERTVPLNKVNDLELDRHVIGRIFSYGTVIPLTGSGIGMGSDFAAVSGTAGKQWKVFGHPTVGITVTGGHTIQVPKTRTHEVLFGIRKPALVRDIIMKTLAERELRMSSQSQEPKKS